jgi:hypothetical protein
MKKVKVAVLSFYQQNSIKKSEKILDQKCGNFYNLLIFFEIFTNLEMKIRTQIFP